MIETIQQETQGAVDQMASGNTQLESGARMVNELVAPLQAMREGANASLTNLTDLANATREQSAASVDIARHVEQIARMAEESSSAIDGAANSASQLEELATAMRTTIAQFRL
jgi:methyl-accepting chemotaxis protein